MSTTPKILTLAHCEDRERRHSLHDNPDVRATVEALDAAQARVKELEADRDAARRERDEAKEHTEAERMLRMEAKATAGVRQDRDMSVLATLSKELTESRASEARMREALECRHDAAQMETRYDNGVVVDVRCPACAAARKAALSTPVSDWLAARDRRVAETQREACALRMRRWFAAEPGTALDVLSGVGACESTPLVEFKPEGA